MLIFARPPVPGRCKTRLIPSCGARGAARVHRALVLRAVRVALEAGCGPVQVWSAARGGHRFLQGLAARCDGVLHHQRHGDLGLRMGAALDHALRAGHPAALLIGTDTVELTPADLRAAAQVLRDGADAVLHPAADGGYVLLGTRRPLQSLLGGVHWSSGQEFVQTCTRLRRRGWRLAVQSVRADIDDPRDLRRARRGGWSARQELAHAAPPSRPPESLLKGAPS